MLQADGTAWEFYSSSSSFSKRSWSTSQIDGDIVTFNEAKTAFTDRWDDTYTKTTETKTPAAATGNLLGTWVNGSRSIELKTDKTAVLTRSGDTITLNYCAEANAVYLYRGSFKIVIARKAKNQNKSIIHKEIVKKHYGFV